MFKIKDLMIKIVPEGREPQDCGSCTAWTGGGCDMGTACPCSNYSYCTVCTDGCSYNPTCYPSVKTHSRPFHGGLAELKAALQQQLAAVEAQEAAANAAMQPRSLEEIETLEGKLAEAIQELRRVKAQMAKGK